MPPLVTLLPVCLQWGFWMVYALTPERQLNPTATFVTDMCTHCYGEKQMQQIVKSTGNLIIRHSYHML